MIMALVRLVRLLIHLFAGVILAVVLMLDRKGWLSPEALTQWWNSVLLDVLNVNLSVHGAPVAGAHMTVANHVSWLDIPLIAASQPTRFVSKSEVRHWPVAGLLAEAAGTFFIRRGKGGARPLLDKLTPHLQGGGSVVIFPEGTTTDGAQVLDFHPRLFAAAIDSQSPVQPIAIRYGLGRNGASIAPFIGDDDLVSHIWRLLKEPELTAELTYCPPVRGSERDGLANAARKAVCTVLGTAPTADAQSEEPALEAMVT